MSLPIPEDETLTMAQVKQPDPIKIDENLTWLRHKLFCESGQIDLLVIEGKYSVEEIARKLSNNNNFTQKTLEQWIHRVENHILHLSTKEGDSRNQINGVGGHDLKVTRTGGIVRFDY